MNIPDEAVLKVLDLIRARDAEDGTDRDLEAYVTIAGLVREELEAAAPFIAAQALRDAARVDFLEGYGEHVRLYREDVAADLRNRADELEAGK